MRFVFSGTPKGVQYDCHVLLIPWEEMGAANTEEPLLPQGQGVPLGFTRVKPAHGSPPKGCLNKIMGPVPMVVPNQLHSLCAIGATDRGFGGARVKPCL